MKKKCVVKKSCNKQGFAEIYIYKENWLFRTSKHWTTADWKDINCETWKGECGGMGLDSGFDLCALKLEGS